jgi:hypothetical protein
MLQVNTGTLLMLLFVEYVFDVFFNHRGHGESPFNKK